MEQCTNVQIAGLAHVVDVRIEEQANVKNYTEAFNTVRQIDG